MDIKLTREQGAQCNAALDDVLGNGYTNRVCPVCGKKLVVEVSGTSGEVSCETPGCFGRLTFRGL